MPRYESYKPSGAEWLGEIPSHWGTVPAKRLFREVSEKNHPEAELLSVTQDLGVVPRDQLAHRVVMPTGQLQTFKLVRANDYVISLRSFQGGIEYSAYTGLVSPAYTVLRKQINANSRYLKHLLKSVGFISELNTSVTGIREGKNISFAEMAYSLLPLPTLKEQERIADFLDQKTAEIDAAIAKKQRLIALLQEQKSILINQAVTRGLNPDVPMRDSGITSIGVVPAHWESRRLKAVVSFITSGPRGWSDQLSDEGAIFLQSGNLNDSLGVDIEAAHRVTVPKGAEAKRTRLRDGDVVICITGANTGRVAVAHIGEQEAYVNQHLSLVRLQDANPRFVAYSLSAQGSTYFYLCQYGLKEGLSLFDVANAPLALPPLVEQNKIVDFLDEGIAKVDSAMATAVEQISQLSELKRTIIAAVVTGRIKA